LLYLRDYEIEIFSIEMVFLTSFPIVVEKKKRVVKAANWILIKGGTPQRQAPKDFIC
jgi:hypothetical protein